MTDIMDAPPAGAPPGEPSIAPPQTLVMPDDSEPAAPKDEESGGGIYGAGEDAWWATLTIKVCGKSLGEREIKALLGGMLVVTAVSIVLAVSGGGGGAVDGDGGAISGAPGRQASYGGSDGPTNGAYVIDMFFELNPTVSHVGDVGDTFSPEAFAADVVASCPSCGSDVTVTDVSNEDPRIVTVQVGGLSRESAYACTDDAISQASDPSSKLLRGHGGSTINAAFPASFVMTQQVTHGGGDCSATACGAYQSCESDATGGHSCQCITGYSLRGGECTRDSQDFVPCSAEESTRTCSELGWALGTDGVASSTDSAFLNVCGQSNFVGAEGADDAGCVTFVDFPSALRTCVNAGARLCTAEELLGNAAHGTGCGINLATLWTSSREECPTGQMKTLKEIKNVGDAGTGTGDAGRLTAGTGGRNAQFEERCTDIYTSADTGVRCCADEVHSCRSGAACHPAGSLLTCSELQAATAAGAGHGGTGDGSATGSADCGGGAGSCGSWENAHRCFTELHGAFQTDSDAGLTSCGGGTEVCAESDGMTGECINEASFEDAANVCMASGSRLCTIVELVHDETVFTGCGHDMRFIWSSSQEDCRTGEVMTVRGASFNREDGEGPRCMNEITGLAAVRCCADVDRRCFVEAGRGHCGATSEACAMTTTMSSASDQQWLECGADQSLRSCAELGWNLDNQQIGGGAGIGGGGTEFVCAESDAMFDGQCMTDITFLDALDACVSAGARLCTLAEVEGREAEDAGGLASQEGSGSCGHTGRVWTSSREDCGASEIKTVANAIAFLDVYPEECTDISTSTGVAAVCCADVVRTCGEGAPCHPRASLLTCDELGWKEKEWDSSLLEAGHWCERSSACMDWTGSDVRTCGASSRTDTHTDADDGTRGATCRGAATFYEAANACMAVGARLCTIEEVENDETRFTGCGFDTVQIWSSTQGSCDPHYAFTMIGSSEYRGLGPDGVERPSTPLCASMADDTAAVRCCADASRLCYDEGASFNPLAKFQLQPGMILTGHDIWCSGSNLAGDLNHASPGSSGLSATQISKEYCAGMCVQRDECLSFDYRRRDGRCCLNMETAATVVPSRDFKTDSDYSYYEKTNHAAGGGCTADQSALSCQELRWFVTGGTEATVCAQSSMDLAPEMEADTTWFDNHPLSNRNGCNKDNTFQEALRICIASGARLCTLDEILSGETQGSGCSSNDLRTWTSSRQDCGHNEIMTAHGGGEAHGTAGDNPMQCSGKNTRNAVRCCADVAKSCPEGTPCHPSGSLLTCSELGWAEIDSAGDENSRDEMQAYHGSQGHVCGESDGMIGSCVEDVTFTEAAAICMGIGARLCTIEEIHADDTRYTGCNFDARYVWTSSTRNPDRNIQCNVGEVMATIGSSEFRGEQPHCTDMLDPRLNIALGKYAISDSELACEDATPTDPNGQTRGYNCNAGNAVDGMFGNDHRWVSTPNNDAHWIAIDLGRSYRVTSLNVYAGWDNGGDDPDSPDYSPSQGLCQYSVQTVDDDPADRVSPDDNMLDSQAGRAELEPLWTTVFEHAEHTTSTVHDDFPAVWARYVRLMIDQSGDCDGVNVGHYARVYEIEVLSTITVRCCADNIRKCYDEGSGGVTAEVIGGSGGGCAADSSLYLCGELGWAARSTEDLHVGGSAGVCGESEGMDGQCHHNVDFKTALGLCVSAGARLCTLDELLNDETSGTGCGMNRDRIWSSSRQDCRSGFTKTAAGSTVFTGVGNADLQTVMGGVAGLGGGQRIECTDITTCSDENPCGEYHRGDGLGVNARCCADTIRYCALGAPCHPSYSLLTCEELGWREVTTQSLCRSNSHCSIQGCEAVDANGVGTGGTVDGSTAMTGDACGELDRDLSSGTVCGASEAMTGFCHEDETFYEAANICMQVGSRLCTLEEIMGDETRYTGCGFDTHFIWTSTTTSIAGDCGAGFVMTAMGSSLWAAQDTLGADAVDEGHPPECRSMLSGSAAVRCCADAQRMCYDQDGPGTETHAFTGTTCTAEESLRTCDELTWFTGLGSDLVCGMSRVHGECNADQTMAQALALCVNVGARLCTLDELMDDETVGLDGATGCGFNSQRVWSSTRVGCDAGQAKTIAGQSTRQVVHPEECTPVDQAAGVVARCCADVARSCSHGRPCHPSNSLLTCSELGWVEHTQVVRGQTAGSAVHICGESDGMDGVCHDDVGYAEAANICLAAGTRLCTVEEILGDETRLTGCGLDTRHVWTKSTSISTGGQPTNCPSGQVLTALGSSEFRDDDPPRCTNMLDPRINLALGKPTLADSYLSRTAGVYQCSECVSANAVDGELTNLGRWISDSDSPDHWLAVDLLHTHRITGMEINAGYDPANRHPDDPDYEPEQGLCSYVFQHYDACAASGGGSRPDGGCTEAELHALQASLNLPLVEALANDAFWVTIVEQTEHATSLVHDDFAAVNARYLRLVIDQSTCTDSNNYARVYEFKVLSATGVRCCADVESACASQSCNGKHEAEDASLGMPPVPITHGDVNSASGSGFVQFFGTGSESMTFNLAACDAGMHQLQFVYSFIGSSQVVMVAKVNGATIDATTQFHATGGWDFWGTHTITANLRAGANTVTLEGPTGGPDLDYLEIRAI
jgi:hypothetical protein